MAEMSSLQFWHGLNHEEVQNCMAQIRTHMAEYSKGHPEMPISYAAGYALSDDFPECTMRELFRYADKNMYIDKNRAKMEEAIKEKQINLSVLRFIKEKGFSFTDCVYCDGLQDQYRVLRAKLVLPSSRTMEVIPERWNRLCRSFRRRRRGRNSGRSFSSHI